MWLPRDERHLLLAYYANIFDLDDRNVARYLGKAKFFRSDDWVDVLVSPQKIPIISPIVVRKRARRINAYGDTDVSVSGGNTVSKRRIKATIQLQKRLEIANTHLRDRQLIEITPHASEAGVTGVRLALEGYDLARRYSHWLERTGLWFREYRDHWISLVVSFIGGVLGALVVQWLSS